MSTTGGRGPLGGPLGDDELGRALSQGLSRAVDGDVDPAALLRGARAGARRIEHRRTVVRRGVGALVVVAILPLGVSVVQDAGFGVSGSADSTAAGGAAPAAPERYAASSAAASGEDVTGGGPTVESPRSNSEPRPAASVPDGVQFSVKAGRLARDAGDVVVPTDALLRGTDLGLTGVSVTSDTGAQSDAARSLPTTVVPLCAAGPAESLVQGGRNVTWTGSADDREGWTVATTVRVFGGSGAADELGRLRRAVGTCPESAGVARETVGGLPGDDVLVAVLPAQDAEPVTVVGVVRRGRVTVGVQLVLPPTAQAEQDRADAVARLRALLVRADARVARFATAADADPTLG